MIHSLKLTCSPLKMGKGDSDLATTIFRGYADMLVLGWVCIIYSFVVLQGTGPLRSLQVECEMGAGKMGTGVITCYFRLQVSFPM